MNINEHLKDRLQNPAKYDLKDEEKKTIKYEGIETYIYKKLTSKKFRKTKIDAESQQRVMNAIKLSVDKGEPIKFTYPFGGYKIWRIRSYPYADWAEFFTISYVTRYVAPVLAAYKPGVEFYFSSDDVCIELIDNYPRDALDKYIESFKKLIERFSDHFPNNLSMELKQVVPDLYSSLEYKSEYRSLFEDLKEQGISKDRREKMEKYFEFNFMMKGKVDYTDADEESFEVLKENLKYWSDAYLNLSKRRDFVRGEDKIVLFSNPIPNAIDIGSLSTSKTKFWTGIGVLEQDNGKIYERIMSPSQWHDNKARSTDTKVDLIDMPNFEDIPVFKERFDFVNK